MADKLRFHTDSWDLSVDLKSGHPDIVVIDARSRQAYAGGHIPGAVSFPHGEMTAGRGGAARSPQDLRVYCDGIGCNASTKGGVQARAAGVPPPKKLLGGLDWWRRDGNLVATSREREPALHGCREGWAQI